MPVGTELVTDRATKVLAADRLLGGTPARVMKLTDAGRVAWIELQRGPVRSPAAAVLARRLTDAGLAHPKPSPAVDLDVTVVVPAYGRAEQLDRCLAAIGSGLPVVVVDDGSDDRDRVAGVVARHGARLVRRDLNGGPAAARNSGIVEVSTELIAFLDSDCVAAAGWVESLVGHFTDPLVAAVAPRVVSARRGRRYLDACSTLDLGARESRVHRDGLVTYVPTAAFLVRRTALAEVGGFDTDLRYGEDVDLVWRLDTGGWRVRYDPSVEVGHDEPRSWRDRAVRRFHYGSSAAPLAQRHPGAVKHLVAKPGPLAAVGATAARRPVMAAAAAAWSAMAIRRSLRMTGTEEVGAARVTVGAIGATWLGVGRYATQFAPLLLAGFALRGRGRRGRVAAVAALAVAPPLAAWTRERPAVGPARYVAGRLADDVAYGAGVYAGCLRHRTAGPLAVSFGTGGSERKSR